MSSMQVTMGATFGVKQVEIARSSLDEEQIPWGPSRLITKLGDLGASDMRRKCTWNDVHLAGKGMMGTSALGDPRARSGGLLELHSRSALPSRFFITH